MALTRSGSAEAEEPRLPLARAEWACVAFAVAVAHGFLVHEWLYPSAWDAAQYLNMAREIAARGLFSPVEGSEMRTYGYPFLLSFVVRAANATGLSRVVLLFALQFVAYIAAALVLRRALAPTSPTAARVAFCGLIVNGYVLIYVPESLTESVSLTLLVLAAGCWIRLWRDGLAVWPVLAGSLIAGFALMVRPANAFLVAAWAFGLALVWFRQRPSFGRAARLAALAAVGFALPVAPQVAINATYHGRATPFVTADVGLLQQSLGVQYIKYATGLPPVPEPPVPYYNPLLPGTTFDDNAPLAWYATYPLRGIATIALHTFNLTDQDLLFTYSRDLRPWYRVPLGIVNHAAVALGLVGLVLLGRGLRDATAPWRRDPWLVLVALIGANWAVYAWTAVEMRFGAVLLLVLFPLAGFAVLDVAARGARSLRLLSLGTAAYVVFALALSGWVREQSPLIRYYERAAANEMHERLTLPTT